MEILLVICLFMTPFKLPGFNSERRFATSFSFSSVHSSVHSDDSHVHTFVHAFAPVLHVHSLRLAHKLCICVVCE